MYTEFFNRKSLKLIIDNFEHIKDNLINREWDDDTKWNPLTIIQKYYDASLPHNDNLNKIEVKYKQNKEKIGRQYAVGSLSLQSLPREIRHTISGLYYYDIDIVNCHPTLLLHYADEKGLNLKYLRKYVEKRTEIIDSFINDYEQPKEIIKTEFIKIINGSQISSQFSNNKFLRKYKEDIDTISNYIFKNEKKIRKIAESKKDYNIKGTITNYIMLDLENKILKTMLEFCQPIIKTSAVLIFDGFQIWKEDVQDINILLHNLEHHIKEKLDINIKLVNKPMNEIIDLTGLKEKDEGRKYEDIKKQFEINHFKLINPAVYVHLFENKMNFKSKLDLMMNYENLYYMESGEKVPFIKKWLKDEKIRTYQEIDFRPKQIIPDYIYNIFKSYEAENKINNNIDITKTKLWTHLYNICGCEQPVMDFVLKCLANIIQQPYRLTKVCLLFKSKEGSGKDSFFNWFGQKIIGSKYYLNDSNIDLIFGKFNNSLENKVLVVINETEHNDTMKTMGKIKDAITKPTNKIEYKGVNVFEQQNNAFYIMLSNNNNPIPVSVSDRRICAIECNNEICNNGLYFDELHKELNSGSIDKAFYDYLNNLDISNYDFTNNRPQTKYYKELKLRNKPIIVQFLCEILDNYPNQNEIKFTANELYEEFKIFLGNNGYPLSYSNTKFGLDIKEYQGLEKVINTGRRFYKVNKTTLKQHLIKLGYYEDEPEVNFIDV